MKQLKLFAASLASLVFALATVSFSFGQNTPGNVNLWHGFASTEIVGSNFWNGQSFLAELSGTGLVTPSALGASSIKISMAVSASTSGTTDINHAVFATTLRNSRVITSLVDLKYAGNTAPYSITTSGCTIGAPCEFTFDNLTGPPDNSHDYYIGVFFTNNSNNTGMKLIKTTQGNGTGSIITSFGTGDQTQWSVSGNVTPPIVGSIGEWGVSAVTK